MEKFLARQPIFNSERLVYGYELLFRSGPENYFPPGIDGDVCTSTLDDLFLIGLEKLTHGRRAFINCDSEFLLRGFPALLPKKHVVIEILENILIDEAVIAACRHLKATGYLIALDDFVDGPCWQPLIELADFVKVDLLASTQKEVRRLARQFARTGVRLLAEKVETYDAFREAQDMGYSYFQGYFFERPEILSHRDMPAQKLSCLRILQAANRQQLDLNEIGEGLKTEAALSYRLLRYLNSPAFFLAVEIRSIPQALLLLGEQGVKKWVSLVALACLADGKPEELIILPIIRARFCELLAALAGMKQRADDLFLFGLLSVLDAVLDMKMADILSEITVPGEIRDALLGKTNAFRNVLDLALLYETGEWEKLEEAADRAGVASERLPDMFMQALEWGRGLALGETGASE